MTCHTVTDISPGNRQKESDGIAAAAGASDVWCMWGVVQMAGGAYGSGFRATRKRRLYIAVLGRRWTTGTATMTKTVRTRTVKRVTTTTTTTTTTTMKKKRTETTTTTAVTKAQ